MNGRDRSTAPVALLAPLALFAVAAVSGCLGVASGPERGPADPRTVASPSACSGDETTPGVGPAGALPASAGGFELTANRSVVERGEPIAFELTNVADDRQTTGTRHRYALQRRVGGGWRTVTLFPSGRSGFNATALRHDPGEGIEWLFRASAAGFSTGKFVVCERLPAGDYRFVYDGPSSLLVRFELVDGDARPSAASTASSTQAGRSTASRSAVSTA
ncbi:hypothetical protein C475_20552 [Halosimplex carlsbadense 2-9-1]|uniref:Uncharacterized protein n=1 Tax=Halosimplex carlsbadense 2-9-1 TaxID=797114 RepID=M0CCW2_9EURY|nr:hypothetical protein C475_20552 [Halosimplex carlsbadense 2-9-1]